MLSPPSPIHVIEDAIQHVYDTRDLVTHDELAEVIAQQLDRWGMLIGSPWGE